MKTEKIILTKEGKEKLQLELKNLIEVERPKVITEIKEAREQGDLSENAEFDAARDKQGEIEDRIQEIEKILQGAKIITKTMKAKTVRVGTKVEIQDFRNKSNKVFSIVGTLEANPFEGKISNQSPLALALIGREKDEIVEVVSETKYKVKIIKISNT